ncbi:YdbC family protein [Bacillus sp. SD075]|uniref:YdbC family protein n=1 Tax=Bacillus sp. SD075 TaxID=2781732 RepID=UPI001A9637A9|nr:YdbC family protein [Bacillus sp. SD075]MBO0998802.1 YdbC family protein [Bacillus sp. SD075]
MLMKWIKCQVNEENKHSFSKAQEGWGELRHSAGFMGQIGGWNRTEPFEAGILSIWKDLHSYQSFMQHQHDEIFGKSDHRSTYTNISVNIYEKIFHIGTKDITELFGKGKLLRVADCSVENEKQAHFEQVQKDRWNIGMTPGMLSGAFGIKQFGRYLIASIWENEYSHQGYVDEDLPELILESGVKDSIQHSTGSLIELHPKWAVI